MPSMPASSSTSSSSYLSSINKSSFSVLFILSCIEVTFLFMEFLFGMILAKDALRALYKNINGVSEIPKYNEFLIHLLVNIFIIYWLSWRFATKLSITPTQLWYRLGINRFYNISKLAIAVCCLHAIGAAISFFIQWYSGNYIFGMGNYYSPIQNNQILNNETNFENNESITHNQIEYEYDYTMISDMLFLAPIREELVFRCLIFTAFCIRLATNSTNDSNITTSGVENNNKSENTIYCVIGSALIFGLVHLLNLFGSKYGDNTYIVLQVLLGLLLGFFYCARFVLSETIWEPIVLHLANNLFSSFLPVKNTIDLNNLMISIPLAQTFVIYTALNWIAINQLKHPKQLAKPYFVLDNDLDQRMATKNIAPEQKTKKTEQKKAD